MDKLITIPNACLRKISQPIEIGEDINNVVAAMIECMYDHGGIGLAAVQIGVLQRVIVTETTGRKHLPLVYINPKIVYKSLKQCVLAEGCLSVPGGEAEVERSADIMVQYHTLDGEHHVRTIDGIEARCVQHEIDHLDGILFTDYLSRLKRERIMKKASKV